MLGNLLQLATPGMLSLLQELPTGALQKLAPLQERGKIENFTDEDFALIGDAINVTVHVTDEWKQAVMGLLRGKSIHMVADLIKSPESLRQLFDFFKAGLKTLPITTRDGKPLNVVKRRGSWNCVVCGFRNISELEDDTEIGEFYCSECDTINTPFEELNP